MIVKRNFSPGRILPYVWKELGFTLAVAGAVSFLHIEKGAALAALPFGPLGVLGTALAIFLGFRNNSGYARWWEARTIWGNVADSSRTLARLVISATDNARKLGKGGGAEKVTAYQREMVLRQAAFAHALRLHLRREGTWAELARLLPPGDQERVLAAHNKPNLILQIQADRLKDGVREEMLGQFDPISLEPGLAALNGAQGGLDRIKDTPMLRQYEFFTRVFLWTFLALLPSSLLGLLPAGEAKWLALPGALVIGFIYAVTNKIGEVTEDPLEGRVQDVPMTAICTGIERDLREQLGDRDLPPAARPVDGYLF
jgi:ion channel-forming bestrophin family protein